MNLRATIIIIIIIIILYLPYLWIFGFFKLVIGWGSILHSIQGIDFTRASRIRIWSVWYQDSSKIIIIMMLLTYLPALCFRQFSELVTYCLRASVSDDNNSTILIAGGETNAAAATAAAAAIVL